MCANNLMKIRSLSHKCKTSAQYTTLAGYLKICKLTIGQIFGYTEVTLNTTLLEPLCSNLMRL